MTTKSRTKQLTILSLMTAVLLLMAYTPLGYLNIGPFAITFNIIPVAICAIVVGPVGGLIAGTVFGLTSFLQCIGIGGTSAMGAILFEISPIRAFFQCFLPRMLDGILLGIIFQAVRKWKNTYLACTVTGFFAAFLNTVFYMTSLILLYGNTEYLQNMIGGRNIIVFMCTFVGINAVCEALASTIVVGAVGAALHRAHLIPVRMNKKTMAGA